MWRQTKSCKRIGRLYITTLLIAPLYAPQRPQASAAPTGSLAACSLAACLLAASSPAAISPAASTRLARFRRQLALGQPAPGSSLTSCSHAGRSLAGSSQWQMPSARTACPGRDHHARGRDSIGSTVFRRPHGWVAASCTPAGALKAR